MSFFGLNKKIKWNLGLKTEEHVFGLLDIDQWLLVPLIHEAVVSTVSIYILPIL